MIILKNPQTGEKHEIDDEAAEELRSAYEDAVNFGRNEVVFRAMRIGIEDVDNILGAL